MNADIMGPIYDTGEDGEPVLLDGWHVNITPADLTPGLEPYVVTPSRLRRVWAGDDPASPTITVALRFVDEAGGRTFFPEDAPHP